MAKIVEEVWSNEEEEFFVRNEQHQTFLARCLLERYQELTAITGLLSEFIITISGKGDLMAHVVPAEAVLVVEDLMKRRLETEKKNKTLYASYMADFSQAQYEQSINPTLRDSFNSEEEREIAYYEKLLASTS